MPVTAPDIASLLPEPGDWSEADYLTFNRHTHRLVELSDGAVEVLPMPTRSHQQIVLFLYGLLLSYLSPRQLGRVLIAPYPMRLWAAKYREPDLLVMLTPHLSRLGEQFADRADLVIEVVSDDRERDLVRKRAEYARAGIPEYWIIDPAERRMTIFKLSARRYVVDGVYKPGQTASSPTLRGFEADVSAVLAAAKE